MLFCKGVCRARGNISRTWSCFSVSNSAEPTPLRERLFANVFPRFRPALHNRRTQWPLLTPSISGTTAMTVSPPETTAVHRHGRRRRMALRCFARVANKSIAHRKPLVFSDGSICTPKTGEFPQQQNSSASLDVHVRLWTFHVQQQNNVFFYRNAAPTKNLKSSNYGASFVAFGSPSKNLRQSHKSKIFGWINTFVVARF